MNFRYSLFIGLGLLLTTGQTLQAQSGYVAPTLPSIPAKEFNIKAYGAVSDNKTDNTQAVQDAIDAAGKAGGGCVVIPSGTYLCGPLQFISNLNFHLDSAAVLRFLPFDRYPGGLKEGRSFISGSRLHDIAITGKGTIDGQGSPWWPYAKVKGARRPRMIVLHSCDKVLIENVTLMNSPMFHIAISGKSSNVTVSGVTVRAPASTDPVNPSHNTDACDVTGKHILIKNCDISTGDDDYTCGGGTSDVLIINCKYGNGHGVSIGSPTFGGISNITVENCTFTNTDCGIRIKSDRDRGGEVKDLIYRNLTMKNVGIPILIYASYNAKDREYRNLQKITPEIAGTYPSAPVTDRTPVYRNIIFQNITATAQKGNRAGLIWGLPEAPVSNVLMQNVHIVADKPFGIFFANNVRMENCQIITNQGKNKLAVTHSQVLLDGKEIK
ncbi:glycoside hydrolase family 28 protein [Microbacter margulisiae]|uniref:Polygalacturonase n=1 Tax=Microbacter margulisiae TaxID=1350067 RepID=A0A7W5H2Q5_9PORP|nr:glycosyl hydrolase family 28 protein [Microbacter margulisiae]MBB3187622.1 polygalacturonase [Microbacter margulisiae]